MLLVLGSRLFHASAECPQLILSCWSKLLYTRANNGIASQAAESQGVTVPPIQSGFKVVAASVSPYSDRIFCPAQEGLPVIPKSLSGHNFILET